MYEPDLTAIDKDIEWVNDIFDSPFQLGDTVVVDRGPAKTVVVGMLVGHTDGYLRLIHEGQSTVADNLYYPSACYVTV